MNMMEADELKLVNEKVVNYKPFYKDDFFNMKPLSTIRRLSSTSFSLAIMLVIICIISIFGQALTNLINPDFIVFGWVAVISFCLVWVFVVIRFVCNKKLTTLYSKMNLNQPVIDSPSMFTELSVDEFDLVQLVIQKNELYKKKYFEVLDFRRGEFFAFDFQQMQTEELYNHYIKLQEIEAHVELLKEKKNNILKER